MSQLRTLVVGLGQIGCGYDAHLPFQWDQPMSSPSILSHARALACHPGFELLCGVDPDCSSRQRFSRLYDLPAYETLSTWRASWNAPDPDVVVVAVSPLDQPGLVEVILNLISPRLLLLEKPAAANLTQARALQQTCSRHEPGLCVAVNYIRRYLPAVGQWQKRLQSGELGKLLHGQITYGKGLMCNGSHFVNLAEFWLGSLRWGRELTHGKDCFGFDRESSAELHAVRHGNASVVIRSVGAAGLRAGEVDLWFEQGRLCWRNDGRSIAFWHRCPPAAGDSHSPLSAEPSLTDTEISRYQFHVLENLYHHYHGSPRLPLQCTLSDAVNTLSVLEPAIA